MVNLRYHIVTLVAVFLALAMGVVLGAGPLQNRIKGVSEGTNFAARIGQLEADTASLQEETVQQAAFITAIAEEALPGSLSGKVVAIVALPDTAAEDAESITTTLETGGAEVAGVVQLTPNWSSVGQREYRETLASPLSSHLAEPASSSAAENILGRALFEVLTLSGSETELVKEILSDDQVPLVEADTLPAKPVNAIIIMGPSEPLDSSSGTENVDEGEGTTGQVEQSLIALAQAVALAPEGAVAVGDAAQPQDFIAILRANAAAIATVDQGGTAMSALNTALALSAGTTEAFGQQEGAETPVAPFPG